MTRAIQEDLVERIATRLDANQLFEARGATSLQGERIRKRIRSRLHREHGAIRHRHALPVGRYQANFEHVRARHFARPLTQRLFVGQRNRGSGRRRGSR